jgi:hypothetical protein
MPIFRGPGPTFADWLLARSHSIGLQERRPDEDRFEVVILRRRSDDDRFENRPN